MLWLCNNLFVEIRNEIILLYLGLLLPCQQTFLYFIGNVKIKHKKPNMIYLQHTFVFYMTSLIPNFSNTSELCQTFTYSMIIF